MEPYNGLEKLSKSDACGAKACYAAMEILKEKDEGLSSKELLRLIPKKVDFNEWEKHIYESTGQIRWTTILYFFSIDLEKAGYIVKQKGTWFITPEGKEALKLGAAELILQAHKKYREWDRERKSKEEGSKQLLDDPNEEDEKLPFDPDVLQKANLEQYEENALDGIKEFLSSKNPYEFQDIVATLLRAMGYFISSISPKGKDGGLDIVAYKDPLGAATPRIKAQVKHKPTSAISVPDIRSLVGLLNKDGDIGLFVTSGTFTTDSERFARDSHIHVKLIDIDHFIQLWIEFYSNMTDEDKNQLPIKPIYYLGTKE
jgi:restriction system protein